MNGTSSVAGEIRVVSPRWDNQTPKGSIDATTTETTNIRRGRVGTIIEVTRIRIAFQDRRRTASGLGAAQLLSIATRNAFTITNQRPVASLVSGACFM